MADQQKKHANWHVNTAAYCVINFTFILVYNPN